MKISPLLSALASLVAITACNDAGESGARPTSATTLTVHTTQRAAFQVVGADTLSDSARIHLIVPESDGDGLVALFTDPARGVSRGLAILDRRMEHPQLVWPDSVNRVWWTGPHRLAFTTATGRGVRLIGDVHAATLKIADTADARLGTPPAAMTVDASVAERARAYTDSVHLQPRGTPQGSALTYSVTRVVPSPDGTMAVFHSAARDSSGVLTNPAWLMLERASGVVTPIDRITGSVTELAAEAGEWGTNTSFFYAKGRAIWEAEVQRTAPRPNP